MKPNHWITIAVWAVVAVSLIWRPEATGGLAFSAFLLTILLN